MSALRRPVWATACRLGIRAASMTAVSSAAILVRKSSRSPSCSRPAGESAIAARLRSQRVGLRDERRCSRGRRRAARRASTDAAFVRGPAMTSSCGCGPARPQSKHWAAQASGVIEDGTVGGGCCGAGSACCDAEVGAGVTSDVGTCPCTRAIRLCRSALAWAGRTRSRTRCTASSSCARTAGSVRVVLVRPPRGFVLDHYIAHLIGRMLTHDVVGDCDVKVSVTRIAVTGRTGLRLQVEAAGFERTGRCW